MYVFGQLYFTGSAGVSAIARWSRVVHFIEHGVEIKVIVFAQLDLNALTDIKNQHWPSNLSVVKSPLILVLP